MMYRFSKDEEKKWEEVMTYMVYSKKENDYILSEKTPERVRENYENLCKILNSLSQL